MALFIKEQGKYRIYELSKEECMTHFREYPTIVCWDKRDNEIGNMNRTENETETLEDMIKWCNQYSY